MAAWGKPTFVGSRKGFATLLFGLGLLTALAVSAISQTPEELHLLWLAESDGVLALDVADGNDLFEIATERPALAVSFDRVKSTVWVLSDHDELTAFDLAGAKRATAALPDKIGSAAELVADAPAGILWLHAKRSLYRFDSDGIFQQEITFASHEQVGRLALDEARSRMWLATRDSLIAYGSDGLEKVRVAVAGIGSQGVTTIAFDPFLDALWVVGERRIQRYDGEGYRVLDTAAPRKLAHVDADGRGGVWAKDALYHIDRAGVVDRTLGSSDDSDDDRVGVASSIVLSKDSSDDSDDEEVSAHSVQANPSDGSAWVLGKKRLNHYALDGALLHSVSPGPGKGKRKLADLSKNGLPSWTGICAITRRLVVIDFQALH